MRFTTWDGELALQGIEVNEAAEKLEVSMDEIEAWRSNDRVPARAVKLLHQENDQLVETILNTPIKGSWLPG